MSQHRMEQNILTLEFLKNIYEQWTQQLIVRMSIIIDDV